MAPKKIKQKIEASLGLKEKAANKLVCVLRDPVKCLENPKIEIHENERFIAITCTHKCQVSFHFGCWRFFKEQNNLKTEKEAIDNRCITPDCRGLINTVTVVKENGEQVPIKKEASASHVPDIERKKIFSTSSSCSKFEPHASKRRAESECESTKSGQPSGSMTPEALQLKEFKQKVKSLGIELRDAKAREVKLRKENERLHNENSKLLSKTLYADEGMSHMTEAFNAMETERQNIEVEAQKKYRAVFRRQQHEIEVLKQERSAMRSDYEFMQQEVLKLRRQSELFDEHVQMCGNSHVAIDAEILTAKAKLIRLQVNHAKDKAEVELVHTADYILALKSLLLWFEPNKIALRIRKQGTWKEFRAHLQVHCELYETYKKDLEAFIERCEDTHAVLLTSLQKTGTFVDFSMPLDIQRPRFPNVDFVEDLLTLLQEHCTAEMLKLDSSALQFDSVNCSEDDEDEEVVVVRPEEISSPNFYSPSMLRLLAQIQNAFPCLSYEAIHGYVMIVRSNNGNKLSGLRVPKIIRQVGKLLPSDTAGSHQQKAQIEWISKLNISNANFSTSSSSHEECCICFELMTPKNVTKLEPCGHRFHSDCIKMWFREKRDCPFCRNFTILNDEYPSVNSLANVL